MDTEERSGFVLGILVAAAIAWTIGSHAWPVMLWPAALLLVAKFGEWVPEPVQWIIAPELWMAGLALAIIFW